MKKGEAVKLNQALGEVGHTGRATGNHLHYEVKVNKNQNFEILNFSDDYLVVQLVFDENH